VTALVSAAHAAFDDERADARYERVVTSIDRALSRCKLENNPDFVSRYPEFIQYSKLLKLTLDENHELGFEVTDETYFAETSAFTAIPEFLITPAFLKSVRAFETLPQAKTLLRAMNAARAANDQLLFFSYESRHLGTPDNPDSFRRLLIVVPGNAAEHTPEKWVQFGIADPQRPASVRNISVVAVTPGANETTQVYFKDYYRTYRKDGSIAVKGRWELGEGDDNCVSCHKSGVLPIFPVEGSVSTDEMAIAEAINERFLSYGAARFDKYLDTAKFGPGFGSARPGSMTLGRSFAANCNSCHHADDMGPLNWPMDSTIINSFIQGGKMPLVATLSRAARAQLYRRLVNDYFAIDNARPGILKAWLLGKNHEQNSTGP
jgi:mono/diheme cytochrome c family protein